MTLFINHRINTAAQLSRVPRTNGAEIDIRYHEDELVLHHDPFGHHRDVPETLESWLSGWTHAGPLILNVKTEGVEMRLIETMNRHGVENWFFLDLSMPYFAIFAERAAAGGIEGFGPRNLAVRFSEREPIDYALAFAGKAGWVWVDCFTRLPADAGTFGRLKQAGFRVCIVSPELQKHPFSRIPEFRARLDGLPWDAVCTKRPDLWGQETAPDVLARLRADYPEDA